MTDEPGRVTSAVSDGVATILLDRSSRHNSFVPAFLEKLEAVLATVGADEAVRAVVLRAAGASFSTGGDVSAFHAHRDDLQRYADHVVGALNRVILAIVRLDQPVVVAVHGMVTGGSLGLVLAGDVVLVAPEASFTPWYREVGFAPDGGWTAMLPAVIGRRRAADALLTNRTISAEEAVAWGLASRLVPTDRVHIEADTVARNIASGIPGSIRYAKRRLWADLDDLAAGLADERRCFVEQVVTAEVAAGMARFLGLDQ